jgi:chaperone required for assembly of F1-ATPase
MAADAARYAETDLVCHLADDAAELRAREEAAWGPLRDWAADALGVALVPADGVRARAQPPESLEAARACALALDDVCLTAVVRAASLLGSIVLAFALKEGRLDARGALEASRVDETFQEERWGLDAEAERRTAAIAAELEMLERVMRALAEPDAA